jgi:hypothetical protein
MACFLNNTAVQLAQFWGGPLLSGFKIPLTHTPKLNGAILCFGASQLDGMVRGQTLGFKHLATFHHPVVYPFLHTSDKEDLSFVQLIKPSKIQESPVQHHNREGRKSQELGHRDIGHFGGCDLDKCREVAVVVQQGMQFDAPFGGAKSGPREKRQAQIHCGSIKGVELVLEAKFFLGAKAAHLAYWCSKRAWKNSAERLLLASASVVRLTAGIPRL